MLRGPSASGKTTAASALARVCEGKAAVLEEDYFRRVVLQPKDDDRVACRRMLHACALAALDSGFHVVLEGILNARHYRELIADLAGRNPGRRFLYYFDVSLEETSGVTRPKPIAGQVAQLSLREWY